MAHFQLCEVSSRSALAWISYARNALEEATSGPDGVTLADDAVLMITGLFDEWELLANQGPTITLSLELSEDELEFLGHAFLLMSQYLAAKADERGFDVSPAESEEFYRALAEAVISTLEFSETPASTEFGEVLRTNWPRTDRLSTSEPPAED